jgi:hypothetical protein
MLLCVWNCVYVVQGYSGFQNIGGPNDNVFVNTMSVGGHYRAVTDSAVALDFNPHTLSDFTKVKYTDSTDANMIGLGSAHPLTMADSACVVNVEPYQNMMGTTIGVNLYKVCPDQPLTRILLNSYKCSFQPYFHSWGLTSKYAILPHSGFYINMGDLIFLGATISEAFVEVDATDTTIMVYPTLSLYFFHLIFSFFSFTFTFTFTSSSFSPFFFFSFSFFPCVSFPLSSSKYIYVFVSQQSS